MYGASNAAEKRAILEIISVMKEYGMNVPKPLQDENLSIETLDEELSKILTDCAPELRLRLKILRERLEKIIEAKKKLNSSSKRCLW